jgi:hypothetical protein
MNFPKHGRLKCKKCFKNKSPQIVNNWKIENNPCHWGSSNPKYLILGFSKGATQSNRIDFDNPVNFDEIAFKGCRNNLTKVLQAVNLLSKTQSIESKINKQEKDFAFASLIRCSVSRKTKDRYLTSGSLIHRSFSEIPEIISNCTKQFLSIIPQKLMIVVMLGVSDNYIKDCKNILKAINTTRFKTINDVAYVQNNILYVHLAHPSPGNGHLHNWINGISNIGKKKELAKKEIRKRLRDLKT